MPIVHFGLISIEVNDRVNDGQAKKFLEAVNNHGLSVMNALSKEGNITYEFMTQINIEVPFGPNVMADCTDMAHEAIKSSSIIPDSIRITIEHRYRL